MKVNIEDRECRDAWWKDNRILRNAGRGKIRNKSRCNTEWTFALNYELSLYYDFHIDSNNRARGCNILDLDMEEIEKKNRWEQIIECPKNLYAPEETPISDIVLRFANNHDIWAETFLDAWHKMQSNGYREDGKFLKDGPKNSWLGYSFLDKGKIFYEKADLNRLTSCSIHKISDSNFLN